MKRLALMAAIVAAVATAQASVLFWQVHDVYDVARGNKIAFNYLTIKNADTGEMLYFYEGNISRSSSQVWGSDDGDPYSASNLVSGDFTYDGTDASVKSFLVQLYDESGKQVAWQYYRASELGDHILDSANELFDGQAGGGEGGKAYPAVFSAMIPEPSSGLLMLFGLAALALRRRRVKALAAVAVAAAVLAPTSAFCGAEDPQLAFVTKGPDHYADGTEVIDGECYALVWSPVGVEPTFYANGEVENGKLIACLPCAKGKRCMGNFSIDKDVYANELSSGTWSVYLLDTRRWNEDGEPIAPYKGMKSVSLSNNAAVGFVDSVIPSDNITVQTNKFMASTTTTLPADAPTPVITGISVKDGQVVITAKNTAPYIQYSLKSGDNPSSVTKAAGNPRSGDENREETIEFKVPVSEGGAFFKVGRR